MRKDLCIAGIATATASALMVVASDTGSTTGDGRYYTLMAEGGWHGAASPFAHRILSPLMASALPIPTQWAFIVVASLSLGLAFAALHRVLRSVFDDRMAWLGLAMLATGQVVQQVIKVPAYIDGVTLAASAMTLLGLKEERWLLVVASVGLGVANHEMALLLVIPVLITAGRTKRYADGAVVAVVGFGVWWLLHKSGLVIDPNDAPNLLDATWRADVVQTNVDIYQSVLGAIWWHLATGLGIAALLAPFGWRKVPQLIRDGAWMLPFSAIACLGATNWGRMFTPALPFIVAFACGAVAPKLQSSDREPAPARR